MRQSRRHHTVPQMLSKRFTDHDGKFHVYYKNRRKKYDYCTPNGVFWKPHFYTSRTADGKKDTTLEDDFSKLESNTDPIIEKIVDAARVGKKPNLSDNEKKYGMGLFIHNGNVLLTTCKKLAVMRFLIVL